MPPGMQFLASGPMRFSLEDVPERERLPVFREVFGRTDREVRASVRTATAFHVAFMLRGVSDSEW